ncbi:hypothetical protein [Bosea sp. 117]|uniref:hypothetical protein n=1 Tax=Bosea sp. 117 TaxID=1125973 RepID=UPI00049475DD|nr:hypothetical protein [Bosea sp. 117]
MNQFEILRIRLIRVGDEWREAPADLSSSTPVWSSFAFFVAGDIETLRQRVKEASTSFGADIMPAPNGAWILGSYSDLERVIETLRA